jgi:hypothetical protein
LGFVTHLGKRDDAGRDEESFHEIKFQPGTTIDCATTPA